MASDGTYFYSMVSFIVISTVMVLVYIFLSMYMKRMLMKINKIEKKLNKMGKK